MDIWFWLTLLVALLGYGIAWAVHRLDYFKSDQAGFGDDSRHIRTRNGLSTLIILGAVGAGVLIWHEDKDSKAKSARLERIEGTLNGVAAVVGAPVENVVKAVADLKQQVADQGRKLGQQGAELEDTRDNLADVERRAEPRKFSEREAAAIKKILSAIPQKGPVDIFLPMGDEETTGYGLQLEALFAAAGWKAGRTQGMYRTGGPPPVFVLHVGQNIVPPGHPYVAVKAAFEAAGLKYAPLVKDLNAVPGGVVIILPPKPKS